MMTLVNFLYCSSYRGVDVGVSRSFHYSSGAAQTFHEDGFKIKPDEFEDELTYDPENEQRTYPVVVLMETDNPQGKVMVASTALMEVVWNVKSFV